MYVIFQTHWQLNSSDLGPPILPTTHDHGFSILYGLSQSLYDDGRGGKKHANNNLKKN